MGDFEVISAFEDTEYQFVFWSVFYIGSIISVLILLNMVIAVMGESFSRVQEEITAQNYKTKLEQVFSKIDIFTDKAY